MIQPTEYQKKLYLVITMTLVGIILLCSLYAFNSNDAKLENKTSDVSIVSDQTDFNITLDTLDANSRKAFYRKQRQGDTILMTNPFDKTKDQETGNRILDAASMLENDPPKKRSSNTISQDLWDMDTDQEPSNLGLVSQVDQQANYRAELLKAREERLARSQDYSAPEKALTTTTNTAMDLEFQASIYRDQFILPGDRVTLILNNPISYKGHRIEKNTFIYAIARIQGSRVMLDVSNINHIPVRLKGRDITDGNIGMYSERAGELWREFQADTQSQGVNSLSSEVAQQSNSPLLGTTISALGRFFRRKKYRERDKILLVNNDMLILTTR